MENRRKGVVLLGAHRWGKGTVARKLAEEGFSVALLKFEGEEVEADVPSATVYDIPPQMYQDDLAGLSARLQHDLEVVCLLSLDDYTSELGALLSRYLGTTVYPVGSARMCVNKNELRAWWNHYAAGHRTDTRPVPYRLIQSIDAFDMDEIGDLNFPLIVKPNALDASIGVRMVENKEGVDRYRKFIADELTRVKQLNISNNLAITNQLLVEEKVAPGRFTTASEFTAHYASLDGRHVFMGICEKAVDPKTFVETAHIFPSPHFPKALLPPVQTAVETMLDALEICNSLSNWEFIIASDNRIALVEGQLRPSGDNVMDVIELATGVNPIMAFVKNRVSGEAIQLFPRAISGIFYLLLSPVVTKVLAIADTNTKAPDVRMELCEEDLKKTTTWQGPRDWFSKKTYIIASGTGRDDLRKKVLAYLEKVEVTGMIGQRVVSCRFCLPDSVEAIFENATT